MTSPETYIEASIIATSLVFCAALTRYIWLRQTQRRAAPWGLIAALAIGLQAGLMPPLGWWNDTARAAAGQITVTNTSQPVELLIVGLGFFLVGWAMGGAFVWFADKATSIGRDLLKP